MSNEKESKIKIHETAYVHPTAVLIGDINIGKNCSVWPHAVIRADINSVTIDEGSNVQDNCVIHLTADDPVHIGKFVTLGHGAIVHGAKIEDNCIIGMNSTVLEGSTVGQGSIIGANALVPTGKDIPPFSLVLGVPGKVVKTNPFLKKQAHTNAEVYIEIKEKYLSREMEEYQQS